MEIRRERLWPRIGWSYESEIFIYKKNYSSLFPFLINLQVLHESGVFLGVICVVRRDPAGTVSGGGKKSKRGGGGNSTLLNFFPRPFRVFPAPTTKESSYSFQFSRVHAVPIFQRIFR